MRLQRYVNNSAYAAIAALRKRRAYASNKKQFDAEYGASLKGSLDRQSLSTTSDYADANLRYLKATGLFLQKGRQSRYCHIVGH